MVVFSVIFGILLHVGSDGKPYPVFSFAALLPWTYFSGALTMATGSLITMRVVRTACEKLTDCLPRRYEHLSSYKVYREVNRYDFLCSYFELMSHMNSSAHIRTSGVAGRHAEKYFGKRSTAERI